MAISKIVQNSLDTNSISLGPKIQSVQVANSTYVIKDDTAVNVAGGFIVVTGQGFQSNCQILISDGTTSNLACSVSFVSSTTLRAQVPAKSAGTYSVYLINGDGDTAIRVNALQYSAEPTWVTTSPLASQQEDTNVSIQLSATGASSYTLQTGSSLPTGLTLASNGLISGTVNTNVSVETTFNFTVEAIDAENQETPKAFSVTITISDPFFNQTILLLDGDGTSGANNNVFRDSSNNNLTITKFENTTQGSFSPYGSDWSNNFGSANFFYSASNAAFAFGTGDFTVEAWVNPTSYGNLSYVLGVAVTDGLVFYVNNGALVVRAYNTGDLLTSATIPALNTWTHVAASRSGTTLRIFVNGVQTATTTNSTSFAQGAIYAGNDSSNAAPWLGYISNLRVVKGSAVYTSNFTPSTTSLTAISGTSWLVSQSNRFVDNSTNNFGITVSGSPKVQRFSPFAPTATYSTTTDGGSGFFDGTGDYLSIPGGTHFNFGSSALTIEAWVYTLNTDARKYISGPGNNTDDHFDGIGFEIWDNRLSMWASSNGTSWDMLEADNSANRGNILIPAFSWTHVAMTRSGNTWRSFVNGKLDRTFTVSGTVTYNASVPYNIGRTGYVGGSFPFNGYIADYKVTAGTALYTGDFTIPSTPLTRGVNTTVLCNFTNAGIFDDTARNVIETIGNVSVNTSVFKFGTGSIRFNTPIGPKLRLPPTPLLNFGTENFTMECWYYPITKPDIAPVIMTNDEVSGYPSNYWALHDRHGQDNGSGTKFSFWCGNAIASNAPVLNSSTVVSNNNWYHLAVTRTSNTLRLFVNGVMEAANTNVTASLDGLANKPLALGRSGYGDSGLNGLVEDVRITKGISRYTSNTSFTPPTSTYPTR
jgi:hypothetical protein